MTGTGAALAAALVLLAAAVALGAGWLAVRLRRLEAARPAPEALGLLQRQIESVREEAQRERDRGAAALREEMGQLGARMAQELAQLRDAVTGQLQFVTAEVGRRLQEGMGLLQQAQDLMGRRLDQAARAVSDVHAQLGTLGEATRRLEALGRDIAGLEQILRAPKVRGGLGEVLLERLLADVLPTHAYRLQHEFRTGERVDAAIRLGDRLVPVDSKFPLENFRRWVEEPEETRRRQARRAFLRDVRARVDEVARKYILPDEGTFNFALMYVPAEHVYYEVVARDEEGGDDVLSYALSRHVVPVSPASFYAYLQVIVWGLRGLQVEQRARDILAGLSRLQGDLAQFREQFETLGRHVSNARNKYDEASRILAAFEAKLEDVGGMRVGGEPGGP